MQNTTTADADDLQAAGIVQHYPCNCQLKEIWTFDQLVTWYMGRIHHCFLSLGLKARFSGEEDPLYLFRKAGWISKLDYELAWLEVDYLEQMWGLCQLIYSPMAEELARYDSELYKHFAATFDSPLTLFKKFIAEEANSCIQYSLSYVEFSAPKLSKFFKLRAKVFRGEEITPKELKQISSLSKSLKACTATELIISVAMRFAPKNAAIKSKLAVARIALAALSEKKSTRIRQERGWGWRDGFITRANPHGGTYS